MPARKTRVDKGKKRKPYNTQAAKMKRAKNQMLASKARFAKTRRPFVEVKGRSHLELYNTMYGGEGGSVAVDNVEDPTLMKSLTTSGPGLPAQKLTFLPLWSFMNPVVGTSGKDMLGRYLTAKYLTCRVELHPPTHYDAMSSPFKSPRLYMIHGWMTKPVNANAFTTPTRDAFTRENLLDHLSNHISQKWRNDGDDNFLRFREKSQLDIKILGYKRIRVNSRNQLSVAPTVVNDSANDQQVVIGQNPIQEYRFKFPMNNRKIKYSVGANPSTSHAGFNYPNDSWIPFVLLYQPDHLQQEGGVDKNWQFRYNNKLWFTDS